MAHVSKHQSLEVAILLNSHGELREWLILLLQHAYQNQESLDIDALFHRLTFLARKDSAENIIALSHYMLVLSLEYRHNT